MSLEKQLTDRDQQTPRAKRSLGEHAGARDTQAELGDATQDLQERRAFLELQLEAR